MLSLREHRDNYHTAVTRILHSLKRNAVVTVFERCLVLEKLFLLVMAELSVSVPLVTRSSEPGQVLKTVILLAFRRCHITMVQGAMGF